MSTQHKLIIAHRGYRARYPENTLASFQAAFNIGVSMIELDVCLSRDRVPVVIHDETLDRTTTGKGFVRDHTISQLKALDAGSWFSPFFKNERISTLEEVLQIFGQSISINIEIKPECLEQPAPTDAIEKQVISMGMRYSNPGNILVSSFEPEFIRRIKAMDIRDLRTGFLTEDISLNDDTIDFMVRYGVYSWNPDHVSLSKDQIAKVHQQGLKVLTYTVNHRRTGIHCFEIGADGIFTDEPLLF